MALSSLSNRNHIIHILRRQKKTFISNKKDSIRKRGLSSLQALAIIVVISLFFVALAYVGSTEANSSQLTTQQTQLNALQKELQSLNSTVRDYPLSLSWSLPVMNQTPTTRNVVVEWFVGQSQQ